MDYIIVGFSKPTRWKPFAWLISALWKTEYDHVYIGFYFDKYERNVVYQASKLSVNFMEKSNFTRDNVIIKEFQISITPENKIKMMQFAIDNSAKAYGMKSAIGVGLVKIFSFFGKKIANPFRDGGKTYICCELAAVIMEQFADAKFNTGNDEISPKDVYDYLESSEASSI
jgi:hypothetical protein